MSERIVGDFGLSPLQDLLKNVVPPGPVLIRTDWLRTQSTKWVVSYEYWTWVLTVRALAASVPIDLVELPLAFEVEERDDRDVPRQLQSWLGNGAAPDSNRQWHDLFADILADAACEAPDDLPTVYGDVYARYARSLREVEMLKRELVRLKADADES